MKRRNDEGQGKGEKRKVTMAEPRTGTEVKLS